MLFSINNPVRFRELAPYEIPDKREINHCDSLPLEITFKIFNFVLSGKGEAPSPKALPRLFQLNLKTHYRLSFVSKTFRWQLDQYCDAIGVQRNQDLNVSLMRALHYHLELAKVTLSYWNPIKDLPSYRDKSYVPTDERATMINKGIEVAPLLCADGLISYEAVVELIEAVTELGNSCFKDDLYHDVCEVFLRKSLFPQVIRLIEEGRLAEKDIRQFKAEIFLTLQKGLLDDSLDQMVINFIDNEIKNGNLEQIISAIQFSCFYYESDREALFDYFVNYVFDKNIFDDNDKLIDDFITKTINNKYKNKLLTAFFAHFVKKHCFDKALELGKKFKMRPYVMALYLIQEKQYQLVFDSVCKNLNNSEMNACLRRLLRSDVNDENMVDFFCLLFDPYEDTTDGIVHSASRVRTKLNPLTLNTVIELFRVPVCCLLEYQAWQIHPLDEKELVDLMGGKADWDKVCVFLIKSLKREFDPCQFLSCVLEKEHKLKSQIFSSEILIKIYPILCDVTLNLPRREALKALLPAFCDRPLFIQELEKISLDYASLIEEMRVQKDDKCAVM